MCLGPLQPVCRMLTGDQSALGIPSDAERCFLDLHVSAVVLLSVPKLTERTVTATGQFDHSGSCHVVAQVRFEG